MTAWAGSKKLGEIDTHLAVRWAIHQCAKFIEFVNRYWIMGSLERASSSSWRGMSMGRAHVHVARILRCLGQKLDEAEKHENLGLDILRGLFAKIPDYMQQVDDLVAVFDSLHGFSEGRFTSRDLLPIIQRAKAGQQSKVMSPTCNYASARIAF